MSGTPVMTISDNSSVFSGDGRIKNQSGMMHCRSILVERSDRSAVIREHCRQRSPNNLAPIEYSYDRLVDLPSCRNQNFQDGQRRGLVMSTVETIFEDVCVDFGIKELARPFIAIPQHLPHFG